MPEIHGTRRGMLGAGFAILAPLLVGTGPAVAQSQPSTPKELMDQLAAAIDARDLDRIAGFYAERAMLLPPQGGVVRGRDGIREVFARNFASGQPPMRLVNGTADGGPQAGVVMWIWDVEVARQGQAPQRRRVRSMLYVRNSPQGWRVVADMFQVFTPRPG